MAWIINSGSARSMMSARGSMASPRMATKAARTAACSAARCGSASTAIRAFAPAPCALQACQGLRANVGRRVLQLLDLRGQPRRVVQAAIDCTQGRADQRFALRPQLAAAGQIGEGRRVELVDQGRPLTIIELRIEEFLKVSFGQLRPAGLKQQLRRVENLGWRGRVREQQCRNYGVFRRRKVDRLPGGTRLLAPGRRPLRGARRGRLSRRRLARLRLGRRLVGGLCRRSQ